METTFITNKVILIFVHSFETGGAQVNLLSAIKHLHGDFDLYLTVFKETDSVTEKDVKKYLKGFYVLDEEIFTLVRNERTISKIEHIINKVQPSLVETHMFYIDLAVREAARRMAFRNVIVYQHGFGQGWKKKEIELEREYISYTRKYLCVTKWNKEVLISAGVPRSKTKVIYNGIDSHIFKKWRPQKHKRFTIGFIGRLEYSKNPLALVDIVRELVERHNMRAFVIRVVGNGSLMEPLKKEIAESRLERFFRFDREFHHDEMMKVFNQIDLLLMPSNNESLPTAAIEAMWTGLPVVASKVGGLSELIAEGKTGFLVSKRNGYSEVISRLMTDETMYHKVLENISSSRDSYRKRFSLETFLSTRKRIWEQLANH